jgi:hypothetical protein
MIRSDKWPDAASPRLPAQCFGTGLEIAAFASLALGAAGTAMNVVGQSQQAQQQAAQSSYQAQVARNNQMIAERNATLAQQQGEVQAQQQQLKTAQLEGSQRAALASQGGDVNSGSPLDILGDTARAGATDVATIRSNAGLNAYGFRLQGANAAGQANLYSANAANTMANLPFGIGSSLLGGASSLANKWSDFTRNFPS